MERLAAAIADGESPERIWLVEHPPLYTAGTSARAEDLLDRRFPVYETGRGGQLTYHGPGQRVAYAILDLNRRKKDVRQYVAALEAWLIAALASFNLRAERREDRVGVWVRRPDKPPASTVRPPRTRSPPSASASGAGSRSTASRSMSSLISPTSGRSCRAASRSAISA